jgi:hypothetical protein
MVAYLGWVAGTLMMSGVALAWYRKVEEIGWKELSSRIRTTTIIPEADTEVTEATE